MSFSELGLCEELLRAISEEGYTSPTPIQAKAIPPALGGKDILAAAQTGTGKTAGFTLPILHRLGPKSVRGRGGRIQLRCLILTPTRELALQVEESIRTYGRHTGLTSAVVFGGTSIGRQIQQLRRGVDILVATPGRLLDHMAQKTVDLSGVQTLVLDEADRMLDMGFIHDIKKVVDGLPKQRQTMLFSATFSNEIRELAQGFLRAPTTIDVAPRNTAAEKVSQIVHPVDRAEKRNLLLQLLMSNDWDQVLVFTRTKRGADYLSRFLHRKKIATAAIHGDKTQPARVRALKDFVSGRVRVLVATDIAARGIDIDELSHVVNYDLPDVPEDYVHRIGRTGRAGAEGHAISLVCVDEQVSLRSIERLIRKEIPKVVIEGFEPDPTIEPQPPKKRGRRRPSKGPTGKRPSRRR